MNTVQRCVKSPIGNLCVETSENGLKAIRIGEFSLNKVDCVKAHASHEKIFKIVSDQLNEYFQGQRKGFDLPLDLEGTEFQKKVWRALLQIPFGKTASYADIAKKIKNPKAVRAVGNANGRNPICIVVPCHRVIASDGGIGGYSGGLSVKRRLLAIEGVNCD